MLLLLPPRGFPFRSRARIALHTAARTRDSGRERRDANASTRTTRHGVANSSRLAGWLAGWLARAHTACQLSPAQSLPSLRSQSQPHAHCTINTDNPIEAARSLQTQAKRARRHSSYATRRNKETLTEPRQEHRAPPSTRARRAAEASVPRPTRLVWRFRSSRRALARAASSSSSFGRRPLSAFWLLLRIWRGFGSELPRGRTEPLFMAVAERFGARWPPSRFFFFVVAVLLVLLLTGEPRNRNPPSPAIASQCVCV